MELHVAIRGFSLTLIWSDAYEDAWYFFYVVEWFLFSSELKGLGT